MAKITRICSVECSGVLMLTRRVWSTGSASKRLLYSIVINSVITVVELVMGILAGSMLLISDAVHNLGDTLSLGVSYVARLVAGRRASLRYTFGYRRAEVLAAFFNSTLLLVLSAIVVAEAVSKLFHPTIIDAEVVGLIGLVALVGNLVSTLLLKEHASRSLNIRSAYLHLLSDTFSSIIVVLGALVVKHTRFYLFDPLASIIIVSYIVTEAVSVLRESAEILMEAAPIDLERVRREIESVPGVLNIHHCHAWRLGENDVLLECHVEVRDMPLSKAQEIINEIEARLRRIGVTHATIQLETDRCREKDLVCEQG